MTDPEIIYLVIIEDRHIDVDVQPYRDRDEAIRAAEREAEDYAREPSDVTVEEITPAMVDDRWIYFASYGSEGDCVRVVQRDLL